MRPHEPQRHRSIVPVGRLDTTATCRFQCVFLSCEATPASTGERFAAVLCAECCRSIRGKRHWTTLSQCPCQSVRCADGGRCATTSWEEQQLQLPHHPHLPVAPPIVFADGAHLCRDLCSEPFLRREFQGRSNWSLRRLVQNRRPSGSVWSWLRHVRGVTVACHSIFRNARLNIFSQFCACCSPVRIGSVPGTFSSPESSNSLARARSFL